MTAPILLPRGTFATAYVTWTTSPKTSTVTLMSSLQSGQLKSTGMPVGLLAALMWTIGGAGTGCLAAHVTSVHAARAEHDDHRRVRERLELELHHARLPVTAPMAMTPHQVHVVHRANAGAPGGIRDM